jgi:galacturonosyltransferase
MKRILILANNDGGLYHFRFELLKALTTGFEVIVCLPIGHFTEHFIEIGCEVVPCEILDRRGSNPIRDIRLLQFYRKVIKEKKPDIVLSYTIKPNVYGGMACQVLHVSYIANVTGLGTAIENGGILSFIARTLYKAGLKKAGCVFFQNSRNRAVFEDNKLIHSKTRLIPGSGVNLERHYFESFPEASQETRFLFVGRIMKDKGIEELLSSIRRIHNEHENVKLDLVGGLEEDYEADISKAEKEGAIVYHGEQTDMHRFYKDCHCVVLPSYHEGMANVLLEASATGRPVIASNINGCKEAFDEGITGLGCEVKNAESLYNAMNQFLALPYEKKAEMGREARKKMEREFDRQIVVDAYLEEIVEAVRSESK